MANNSIERKSFGRTAAIGDLYDARTDSFCGSSLFSDSSTLKIRTLNNPWIATNLLCNASNFDKLIKCDTDVDLAISVACGLVSLSNFPNGECVFKSCRSLTEGFLVNTVSTKVDQLEDPSKLLSTLSFESFPKSCATHVVVGIKWGSNSVLQITNVDEDVEKLEDHIQRIASQISTNSAPQQVDAHNLTFRFDNDLGPYGHKLKELNGIIEFIRNVPKLIESDYNGRGKCLSFILLPLSSFGNFQSVQQCDFKLLFSLGDIIDDVNEALLKICNINTLIEQNECYVTADVIKSVKLKKAIMEQSIKNIKKDVVSVRDHSDCFKLEMLKQTLLELPPIDQFIEGLQNTIDRINFINFAKSHGAYYIGQKCGFEEARRKIKPKDEYYVLFYYSQSADINIDVVTLFTKFLEAKKIPCFLADVEMQPDQAKIEKVPEGTRICRFVNGQYNDLDVYNTYKEERVHNVTRSTCNMSINSYKPKKRAVVNLICPGSLNGGKCSEESQEWICEKCKSNIEYGFDERFYCECGNENVNTFQFRCNDMNHGEDFIGFDLSILKLKLEQISMGSEINILVLGETGVGKSTWINALFNYLTFPTLNEAIDGKEILYLIPTQFTLLDEEYKERIVSMGSSKNEETRAGQACTQDPTVHVFTVNTGRIRIIDTPGMGDPRGVEQDKINVNKILRFVSNLDEIHAICLLLKPNSARLTSFFKFCIKEILAHLHKSCVDNLLFCFTNTRSTFYKPGDTYPALKELLLEINDKLKTKSKGAPSEIVLSAETMFCLDNEAFRFLCARQSNIEFKTEDLQNFSLSWDKSASETQRMLSYIKSRKPHSFSETVSINEVRNSILILARPMAKISDNIATNIRVAEKQKKFMMSLDAEKLKLEKYRLVEHIQLRTKTIDYPKTVCTNAKCIEVRKISGTSEHITHYKTVCHDHCFLKGVNVDTVGAPELSHCSAMKSRICRICECSWKNHMHITYEFEEVKVFMADPSIEKMIKDNVETKTVQEHLINNLEDKIKQYKIEQDHILTISSQFGSLLKANAIIPYNDAFESYVRHELRMASAEEFICADSANKKASLENLLHEYLEKKLILDEAMEKNKIDEIIVDDVGKLKEKLMGLKLTGEFLKESYATAMSSQSQIATFVEQPVKVKRHNRSNYLRKAWNWWKRSK